MYLPVNTDIQRKSKWTFTYHMLCIFVNVSPFVMNSYSCSKNEDRTIFIVFKIYSHELLPLFL